MQEQIEADPVKTLLFSYDQTNQLTGKNVSGGNAGEAYNTSYTYDASGNRTRKDVTQNAVTTSQRASNNALNQTTSLKTTVGANAPITSGFSYDDAGNVSQVNSPSGATQYEFDDASRLSSLVTKDAAGVNQSKTEFTYDGLSRLRISKTFAWQSGAWVQNGETRRVYDGMNVVQERDGAGDTIVSYTRGLDMGGGIGGLLARASSSGTNAFYHYDGRGNVTGLTDVVGNVSGRYVYDAFGVLLSSSGVAASANSYRFSTKEQIGALVYYGYRFYAPSLGKWINRDPIQESGGINLYGFVGNSSINLTDSLGLHHDGKDSRDFNPYLLLAPAIAAAIALCVGFPAFAPFCMRCVIGAFAALIAGIVEQVMRYQFKCIPFDFGGLLGDALGGCFSGMVGGFLDTRKIQGIKDLIGSVRDLLITIGAGIAGGAGSGIVDSIRADSRCSKAKRG